MCWLLGDLLLQAGVYCCWDGSDVGGGAAIVAGGGSFVPVRVLCCWEGYTVEGSSVAGSSRVY